MTILVTGPGIVSVILFVFTEVPPAVLLPVSVLPPEMTMTPAFPGSATLSEKLAAVIVMGVTPLKAVIRSWSRLLRPAQRTLKLITGSANWKVYVATLAVVALSVLVGCT